MTEWERMSFRQLMDHAHYCDTCDSVYYTWDRREEHGCLEQDSHHFNPLEKKWGRLSYLEGYGHEGPFYYFLKNYDSIWATKALQPYRTWNYCTASYDLMKELQQLPTKKLQQLPTLSTIL